MSHVRTASRAVSQEDSETLQSDVVSCCSGWLMTLSGVVLWLRLPWFIATAHNVIRPSIHTQQNCCLAIWSHYVCVYVCVCGHTHTVRVIFIQCRIILWWFTSKGFGEVCRNPFLVLNQGIYIYSISLWNIWWMCSLLTEIARSVFVSPVSRSYTFKQILSRENCPLSFGLSLLWQARIKDSRFVFEFTLCLASPQIGAFRLLKYMFILHCHLQCIKTLKVESIMYPIEFIVTVTTVYPKLELLDQFLNALLRQRCSITQSIFLVRGVWHRC